MSRFDVDCAAEEEIAAGVVAGDPSAVRRLNDALAHQLFQYFYLRVGRSAADAEDLVQDTLIAAIRGLPGWKGTSRLRTWVISIARRKLVDFYRARGRRPVSLGLGGGDLEPACVRVFERLADRDVVDRLEGSEDLARYVQSAIARLTPPQRDLLIGMYEEGMSLRDLAREHGLSLKAAESALFRARNAFRKYFCRLWRRAEGTEHPVARGPSATQIQA